MPKWASEAWQRFKAELHAEHMDFDVWTRWYEDRLRGGPVDFEEQSIRAGMEPEWFDEGPGAYNAELKRRLREAGKWHDEVVGDEPEVPANNDDALLLDQKEAAFRFDVTTEGLIAVPGDPEIQDRDLASTLRAELLDKLDVVQQRAMQTFAASRLQNSLAKLRKTLGSNIDEVNAGLLLSASRSVMADYRAFDTPAARDEILPEVAALLGDAVTSIEDLMAAFPAILKIERNRIALGMQRNEIVLQSIRRNTAAIKNVADESPVVLPSARQALSAFDATVSRPISTLSPLLRLTKYL
jgi:hypothetical protein